MDLGPGHDHDGESEQSVQEWIHRFGNEYENSHAEAPAGNEDEQCEGELCEHTENTFEC